MDQWDRAKRVWMSWGEDDAGKIGGDGDRLKSLDWGIRDRPGSKYVHLCRLVRSLSELLNADLVAQRAAVDSVQMNGCGCVPGKVHVQQQAPRRIFLKTHSLLTHASVAGNC